MPLYEYKCKNCGAEFELLVPTEQRDDCGLTCSKCKQPTLERMISVTAKSNSKCGSGTCTTCSGGTCSTCG